MKRSILTTTLLLTALALLSRPEQTAAAVRQGLHLCASAVLPALFPFFVLSSLLVACGGADAAGQVLAPVMGRLFGCSGAGGAAVFLGLAGGYPLGARTVGELLRSGRICPEEAEHLLSFCNNAGPAFLLSVVGSGVFHDIRVGMALWLIHVLSALLTGILLCRTFRKHHHSSAASPSAAAPQSFPTALAEALTSAGTAAVSISAAITFFLVLLTLLTDLTGLHHPLLVGFVELTNGLLQLSPAAPHSRIWAAALLGWGGCSVHCQTMALLSGLPLHLRYYFMGKILQSLLSAAFAALLWA